MPIARQRVAKHIPAEANSRNNRRSNVRQRRGKQAVFSVGPCKVDIRDPISEAGSCGRTRMRIEAVQSSKTELACEKEA
jgi:hypothetical protein